MGIIPAPPHGHCQSHPLSYRFRWLQALPGITCLGSTAPDAGLISFQVDQSSTSPAPTHQAQTHKALVDFLEARGGLVRSIPYPNCVRVGMHYFTLVEECDHLVTEIAAFLA